RLNALVELYDDELSMTGLENWRELNGLKLSHWPKRLQRGLERRKISAIILRADTSIREVIDTEDVRREVFERLNTGGEKLNAQELRNCLYSGSLNEVIIRCSREEAFTKAWGIPS